MMMNQTKAPNFRDYSSSILQSKVKRLAKQSAVRDVCVFISQKGGFLKYLTPLERDYAICLDAAPEVSTYAPYPQFKCVINGIECSVAPTFQIMYADEKTALVDVIYSKNSRKLSKTRRAQVDLLCDQHGFDYKIITELELYADSTVENLRSLRALAGSQPPFDVFQTIRPLLPSEGFSYQTLIATLDSAGVSRTYLKRLLAHRLISFDHRLSFADSNYRVEA